MTNLRTLLAVLAASLLCLAGADASAQAQGPAQAGTLRPVEGTPVWLITPPGFDPVPGVAGFVDAEGASIIAVLLPAQTFRSLPASVDELKRGSELTPGRRIVADGEEWRLSSGETALYVIVEDRSRGELITAHMLMIRSGDSVIMVVAGIPDGSSTPPAAMRAVLRSVRIGALPSDDAKLAALPFMIGDRADLRLSFTVAGTAAAFTEGPLDTDPSHLQPRVIVGLEPSGVGAGQSQREAAGFAMFKRSFPGAAITSARYESATQRHFIEATGEEDGVLLRYIQIVSFQAPSVLRTICAYRANLPFADRCLRVARSAAIRP